VGAFAAARSLTVFYQKRRNSPTDYKILFLTLFLLTLFLRHQFGA
jgi:hypothetical protein